MIWALHRISVGAGLCAILASPTAASPSRRVELSVGDRLPAASAVRGTRRYVRYRIEKEGARRLMDIWQRTANIERRVGDTGPRLHITQRWDEADGRILTQDSWFDPDTLTPLTHVRREMKEGRSTVRGFRFTKFSVDGLSELANNESAGFHLALKEAVYNFEYDMELLETLPLAQGVTFDIPFYDAGIDRAPGRYPFVVAGIERIAGWDGKPVDCWLVTGDYGTGKILNRIWISKVGRVVVREESPLKDGGTLVKSLLPPE